MLPNGRRVAVKVQRPNAPRQIESDIQLLEQAARLVKERVRALDFVDTREIVDEFARSIRQELDYRQEGRNAQAFHRNFAGHPHVAVPRVYWSYTSKRVLTLEYLDGVQLADLEVDAWTMEQRRRLAYVIAEAWMTMIFRHGFFHGDPHPANILVLSPERIGLVDFGLSGKLTDRDLSKLTRLFIDAAHENIEVLPKRLADLGVRYPKEKEEEFISELHHDLLPLLRLEPERDRPAPGDPRGVRADLLDEPAPADAVRDARQGDRDDRLGRRRPLPGTSTSSRSRSRTRAALMIERFTPRRVAAPRAARGDGASRRWRRRSRTRSTRRSSRCGTARSRSASSTRGSTT